MSERKTSHARRSSLLSASMLVALAMPSASSYALEVGFQGLLEAEASDNVFGANSPDEEDGNIQSLVLGIYGEQRSQVVTAAFSGEIDTQNTATDDDSSVTTITRFLGAAEFKITPRSWTWYVGDILGGVRNSNDLQPIDDTDLDRRNIFVTGPTFAYEEQGISRTLARALYVNQTQDNESLETLYIADISHERDLTTGSYYGASLGTIFTDLPESDDDSDFNRISAALFYNKRIGFLNLYGEVGATQYNTDNESVDGFTAELRATQQLGPQTSASVYVLRDLTDQNLNTIQSLVESDDAVGVVTDTSAAFFAENTIGAEYSFQSTNTTVNLGVGASQLDFQLVANSGLSAADIDDEDRQQGFAFATWSQSILPRLRSELGLSYETEDFDNIEDNSESLLLRAQLVYTLSRSFDLEFGLTHDQGTGLRTVVEGGVEAQEDIDVTENRVSVGLRWAPPSRASQDLTIELKSLLQ